MDKLAIDQDKISKCEHCGKMMYWLLRRENVNPDLTDEDIHNIATRGLGANMQEWCESCDHYTLQTVVAFDLKKLTPNVKD